MIVCSELYIFFYRYDRTQFAKDTLSGYFYIVYIIYIKTIYHHKPQYIYSQFKTKVLCLGQTS